MANYTPEQVQQALDDGLITEQDAQYLTQALESEVGTGAALGGIAGGAMGAMVPGGAMGKLGAAAGGAALGALAGGAMAPSGGGVEGYGAYNPATGQMMLLDRDMALRLLMDPNTPPAAKKKLLASLQQLDAQEPPAEQGYGEGVPWGALTGGLAGALGGGYGGMKVAQRMARPQVGELRLQVPGMESMAPKAGAMGDILGALGGSAVGAGAGAPLGGMMAPRSPSPYADPLAQEGY